MNFETRNIPYESLKKIGLSKKEVLSWSPDELKSLLSGRTTQLKTISDGAGQAVRAKISLYPESDGSLGVKVHPVREKVNVPQELSEKQGKELEAGKNVVAIRESKNGVKEPYIYKVDKETNEVLKTRVGNIHIPRALEGVLLDNRQKNTLLEGKEIEVRKSDGSVSKVSIDISSPNGYVAQKQEVANDLKKASTTLEGKKVVETVKVKR